MRLVAASLICVGVMACSAPVFAEDPPASSQSSVSPQELMQDCMQQVKERNPGAADADLQTACNKWVAEQMQRINDSNTTGGAVPDQSNRQSDSSSYSDQSAGGTQPR